MTTYSDVIKVYADALEQGAETLTDAQKKQAVLNAILDGQRVEPFATWCDNGDAISNALLPNAKTLNQIVTSIAA